jgi:hypothetical protein
MKKTPAALIAASIVLAAGLFSQARATTVEGFNLDNGHTKVHKSYGPLPPGAYDQVLVPGIADCDATPSDALIPIQTKFSKTTGSLFKFVVNWAEANTYINIYFLDEDDNVIAQAFDGPPSAPKRPKEVNLGSLENGTYYLCVINSGGANTGFTVDATVTFASGYKPPPSVPTTTQAPEDTPPPAETAPPTAPPTAAPAAAPLGEPVATPGPDGPDSKQGLLAVSGNKQASAKNERSIVQLVFLILTVAIGAAGIVLVALRIRRDTT